MKRIYLIIFMLFALVIGSAIAGENFGVNPPMTNSTTAMEDSVARDLAERGLIPLNGEGWAKRPIPPAGGYNAEGIVDTSSATSVEKPTPPASPVAPKAPKM